MREVRIRPMPAASFERVVIEGPAGAIETAINDPGPGRRGFAQIVARHFR